MRLKLLAARRSPSRFPAASAAAAPEPAADPDRRPRSRPAAHAAHRRPGRGDHRRRADACRRRCARPASRSMSATPAIQYLKDAVWVEEPGALFARLLGETIAARTGRVVLDPQPVQPRSRHAPDRPALVRFGLDPDRDGGGRRLRRRDRARRRRRRRHQPLRGARPGRRSDRRRGRPRAQPGRQPGRRRKSPPGSAQSRLAAAPRDRYAI